MTDRPRRPWLAIVVPSAAAAFSAALAWTSGHQPPAVQLIATAAEPYAGTTDGALQQALAQQRDELARLTEDVRGLRGRLARSAPSPRITPTTSSPAAGSPAAPESRPAPRRRSPSARTAPTATPSPAPTHASPTPARPTPRPTPPPEPPPPAPIPTPHVTTGGS